VCSGDVADFRCQTILFFVSREAMALIGAVGGAWWWHAEEPRPTQFA
jgi:hypothetical protein